MLSNFHNLIFLLVFYLSKKIFLLVFQFLVIGPYLYQLSKSSHCAKNEHVIKFVADFHVPRKNHN